MTNLSPTDSHFDAETSTNDYCADSVFGSKAKPRRDCAPEQCERARQLMLTEIEFMNSPGFKADNASEIILAETPPTPPEKDDRMEPPKGTPPYLRSLYETALLTPEQEYHLFRQMNYLKYLAERLRRKIDPECPNVGRLDQIDMLLKDANDLRNRIVQANLRLVVSIAKTLVDSSSSFSTLVSDGNVPLIRAVEIFDFERGLRFSTYATWAVRNCLHRSVPRNRKIRSRFQSGIEGIFDGNADEAPERIHEEYHHEIRSAIDDLLPSLTDREQFIVRHRFGLTNDDRPRRFREIAEKLNLSTERVRQLFVRSIDRLRETATEQHVTLPDITL